MIKIAVEQTGIKLIECCISSTHIFNVKHFILYHDTLCILEHLAKDGKHSFMAWYRHLAILYSNYTIVACMWSADGGKDKKAKSFSNYFFLLLLKMKPGLPFYTHTHLP